MNIDYQLDHDDFLTFQLFVTSKLEAARKRRRKVRTIAPLIYLALGFWLYFRDPDENYKMTIILAIFAVVWYFFYPKIEGISFRKRLLKYIHATYQDTLPMTISMNWTDDGLISHNEGVDTRIDYQDFEEIQETGDYFFIKLNSGSSLILPKQKIGQPDAFRDYLINISKQVDIPYEQELQWKWR